MTLLQQKQPITLTREDLHRNVWETPTSRLCAEYGISGRGLKKICDRLNVPTPSRGYSARLAAGQRVNQIPLPGATPTTHLQVIITPTLIPLPARPAPDIDPETAERLSNAQAARAGIVVPATLRHPHPAIAAWIARHEREISAEHRDRSVWGRPRLTKPFTSLERRQQRILSTLFKEIEKLGYKISGEAPYQLSIDAGRNKIKFTLREWIKQLRRPLTEEEKAGRSFSKQRWRQESVATGELILTIKTFIEHGLAREWRDKERPLEEQIGEIIAVLEVAGPILQAPIEGRGGGAPPMGGGAEEGRRTTEARSGSQPMETLHSVRQTVEEAQLAESFLDALEKYPLDSRKRPMERGPPWNG